MTLSRSVLLALVMFGATGLARADDALAPAIKLFEGGRYADAKPVFAAYAAAHPDDADALFWNGRTLVALNDVEHGRESLEKAAKIAPKRADVQLALGRAYAREAMSASLFRKPGLAKGAREAWEQAVALDPDNLDARASLVQFHSMAPGIMGGSADEAKHQADEIGKRDAVRGALAHADIALLAKDYAGGEQVLAQALAAHPGETKLAQALGIVYQAQKKWDAAFKQFEAVLAANPDAWPALYQIGRTAALSGQQLERGAAALKRYLGHAPTPDEPAAANAHYRLGMVLELAKDRDGARSEYRKAIELDANLDDAKKALDKLG
jgi:tetratricopeptide (TPR) repeat protein